MENAKHFVILFVSLGGVIATYCIVRLALDYYGAPDDFE